MAVTPDPIFDDPRLAAIYDDVDGARDDLDHYVDIIDELEGHRVLDVGCGTGSLACRLARAGLDVTGVDPARASLDVALTKPGAADVRWIHGDMTSFPTGVAPADVAVMTGNVAQVFVTDDAWRATLDGITAALRQHGHLVFETRDPTRRAWEQWDSDGIATTVSTARGDVETWTSVLDVTGALVSFRHHYRFGATHEVVTSDSTLRFRSLGEIEESLLAAGFTVDEVRDAPDRPGRELVVLARAGTDDARRADRRRSRAVGSGAERVSRRDGRAHRSTVRASRRAAGRSRW